MEIKLSILNNYIQPSESQDDVKECTWYSKDKTYISNTLDDDMINSTVGHFVDRIILNDIQLTSRQQVDDLILFLKKSKDSFKY